MSLADGDPRCHFGREAGVADLYGLHADAAEDEFVVDRFTGAHVHDRSIAGKGGDRIPRRSERADVFVRKGRRHRLRRFHGLRRHDRRWRWWRLDDRPRYRWWGRRRRFFVREQIAFAPVAAAL